jgi:enoyl-CoA hydratase
MTSTETILRREGNIGRITLNRPDALNALTLQMVRDMWAALRAWENDPEIAAVAVDGAGERGLCAGGDIRALYDAVKAGDTETPAIFWREEYYLNALIARYPKPYVAFMDGIVMGGGVGVSAHGSHRLVTEKTMIAMPETSIGFFPDVGGTYLLAQSPGELGTHVALTSGRLNAGDAILTGLADTHIASQSWPALVAELARIKKASDVDTIVRTHLAEAEPAKLGPDRAWIDRCYAHDTVEAIVAALQSAPEAEAQKAAATILKNSPTALKVTLRALRADRAEARLEPCLDEEYRMALRLAFGPDFAEGIRAAVVDKDRKPRWQPAALADVAQADIDHIFESLGDRELGLATKAHA